MPHLLVDISHHGFGHVSQTSAVVNELTRLNSDLRVTVRTTAPLKFLQTRFECEFQYIPVALDFGMKMANAVDVQVAESAAAYRNFHNGWNQRVEYEAQTIRQLKPDFLFANVPYLSLAAARLAGIRAAAMCSLNWADIFQHYNSVDPSSQAIYQQMIESYNSAEYFLKVEPAMAMPALHNACSINAIARIGRNCRSIVVEKCALREGEKLVLIAMGGIEFYLPMHDWPSVPGVRWVVPQSWEIKRDDTIDLESLQLSFTDVLSSCDALITKPGYGTFTEAACAGIPVLYIKRGGWPEEPYLLAWLYQNVACLEVRRNELQAGLLEIPLKNLWNIPRLPKPEATGAVEAATLLNSNFL